MELKPFYKNQYFWPLVFIILSSLLRLLWASDMEWKEDEIELFEKALLIARGKMSWPWVGVKNGVGLYNPGFGLWPFAFFAKWSSDPVSMVRWVQYSNIGAIFAFALLIHKKVKSENKRLWLWGLALFSVSPLPILWSRKIWIQNMLPPFCVALLWGHFYRKYFWAATLWALMAVLAAQVHMSGFYWGAGLFAATVFRAFKEKNLGKDFSWWGWLLGTSLGMLILLPWLWTLFQGSGPSPLRDWSEIFTIKFYTQWFGNAWGIDIKNVAKSVFFKGFMKEALLGKVPTYLMLLAHVFLLSTGVFLTGEWLFQKKSRAFFAQDKELSFYITAAGLFTGLLMQLSGVSVHAHYEIILFPFVHLWAATLLISRPKLLGLVVVAQLLVSATFLNFIHREGGIPRTATGAYGTVYRLQGYKPPLP